MVTIFFNADGVQLIDFKPKRFKINSDYFINNILLKLADLLLSKLKFINKEFFCILIMHLRIMLKLLKNSLQKLPSKEFNIIPAVTSELNLKKIFFLPLLNFQHQDQNNSSDHFLKTGKSDSNLVQFELGGDYIF